MTIHVTHMNLDQVKIQDYIILRQNRYLSVITNSRHESCPSSHYRIREIFPPPDSAHTTLGKYENEN